MSSGIEGNRMSIVLKNQSRDGELLEAVFLPERGMNLISYKKSDVEVIDQATRPQFEARYAGLGALIGPHFHHKRQRVPLPELDRARFPHIANLKGSQTADYFSHGIGRYAPWKAEASENKVHAVLTGKDLWNDLPLATLEGQNFKMTYDAELTPDGLHIEMSVISDTDSIVGIHYYYTLPEGKGTVKSAVQKNYIDASDSLLKPIPETWLEGHNLLFDLKNEADFTFYPFPDPLEGKILLETEVYALETTYSSKSQENAWQLYHPAGASFVCIEPVSAQDPRHANLSVSSLLINLKIARKQHA